MDRENSIKIIRCSATLPKSYEEQIFDEYKTQMITSRLSDSLSLYIADHFKNLPVSFSSSDEPFGGRKYKLTAFLIAKERLSELIDIEKKYKALVKDGHKCSCGEGCSCKKEEKA